MEAVNQHQYLTLPHWTLCTPETARQFSAVGYYFGKTLQDSLQIPIGLICNAVGGSPTESWISRSLLEKDYPEMLEEFTRNALIQDWVRRRAGENIRQADNSNQCHPYHPCYLYETAILPLDTFPIRGVIWYQGESNAHNCDVHARLFTIFTKGLRAYWQQPDLPIYFVQLSSLNRPQWTWFRDSQRQLMQALPHTGMAVSSDCGDSLDVHPRHKRPIGQRLALWPLHDLYQHQVMPSGPLYRSVQFTHKAPEGKPCAVVTFDYAQGGLHTSDGQAPRTFEVADAEGVFHSARAEIKGCEVWLYQPEVTTPTAIRYGWQPFTRANLTGATGLPASTFLGK